MDRGMDRVWVWVCDPSLMFLAVAIYLFFVQSRRSFTVGTVVQAKERLEYLLQRVWSWGLCSD